MGSIWAALRDGMSVGTSRHLTGEGLGGEEVDTVCRSLGDAGDWSSKKQAYRHLIPEQLFQGNNLSAVFL